MSQPTKADLQQEVKRLSATNDLLLAKLRQYEPIVNEVVTLRENIKKAISHHSHLLKRMSADKAIIDRLMSQLSTLRMKHGEPAAHLEDAQRECWTALAHHYASTGLDLPESDLEKCHEYLVNPWAMSRNGKTIMTIQLETVHFLQQRKIPLSHFRVDVAGKTKRVSAS